MHTIPLTFNILCSHTEDLAALPDLPALGDYDSQIESEVVDNPPTSM